jgi:tRNA pseudouridine38-40 synthase
LQPVKNYKLIIQYDGTNYAGWQIQKNADSVQQRITDTLAVLLKEKVVLTGSGRTDAGVHALGQAANFQTEVNFDKSKLVYQLNSILPNDIAILSLEEAQPGFNARFDAKKRTYFYLISRNKSPFLNKYSYFYHRNIDTNELNNLSSHILGKYDCSSFCKKKSEVENKVCEIYSAHWKESKELLFFEIQADRFLHGMVRTVVGTLLYAGLNKLDKNYLESVIKSCDRDNAGEAVPAKGLFLYKVRY